MQGRGAPGLAIQNLVPASECPGHPLARAHCSTSVRSCSSAASHMCSFQVQPFAWPTGERRGALQQQPLPIFLGPRAAPQSEPLEKINVSVLGGTTGVRSCAPGASASPQPFQAYDTLPPEEASLQRAPASHGQPALQLPHSSGYYTARQKSSGTAGLPCPLKHGQVPSPGSTKQMQIVSPKLKYIIIYIIL